MLYLTVLLCLLLARAVLCCQTPGAPGSGEDNSSAKGRQNGRGEGFSRCQHCGRLIVPGELEATGAGRECPRCGQELTESREA